MVKLSIRHRSSDRIPSFLEGPGVESDMRWGHGSLRATVTPPIGQARTGEFTDKSLLSSSKYRAAC